MKKQDYKDYSEYLKTTRRIEKMQQLGIKIIYKKSKLKMAFGFICLTIAIIPNGLGIIFLPLSAYFFGSAGIDIQMVKEKALRRLKFKIWRFFR